MIRVKTEHYCRRNNPFICESANGGACTSDKPCQYKITIEDYEEVEEAEMSRIDEIKARCEAATPGEWVTPPTFSGICSRSGDILVINRIVNTRDADVLFIAHAREDIPYLLGEVERLTAALDATEKRADALKEVADDLVQRLQDRGWDGAMAEADRDRWKQEAESVNDAFWVVQKSARYWKARCEALERALRESSSCQTCVNMGTVFNSCDLCDGDFVHWKFDEARFRKEQSDVCT